MNSESVKRKIFLDEIDHIKLFGANDQNLKIIEQHFDINVIVRGNEIILIGEKEETKLLEKLFGELLLILKNNGQVTENDLHTIIQILKSGNVKSNKNNDDLSSAIVFTKESSVKPKTPGQKKYYLSTKQNDIVFVIGPAGTGKTYLAVAIALAHLRDKRIDKLILARPAVEAGESLGFLPGDLREKVDPYLRPLYDALFDMVIPAKLKKYMENGTIEIVPLAYMRGRTLNNAFVILDEAQNTHPNQMKMFLTRLGTNSKAIITGDVTQIDLPDKSKSGLVQIQHILKDIRGIEFVYLSDHDVVRHRLVKQIIKAYEEYSNNGDLKEMTKEKNN